MFVLSGKSDSNEFIILNMCKFKSKLTVISVEQDEN